MPNRSRQGLPIASVAIAALALGLAAIGRGEPPRAQPVPQDAKPKGGPPTPEWATAQSCNTCHRPQKPGDQSITDFVLLTEFDIWKASDKHHEGFESLKNERGQEMQRRLDWKDVTTDARCLNCHAPAAALAPKDTEAIAEGVSCVACHGANKEWVETHGGLGNKTKQEVWIDTPAEVKRDKFGMTDLRDPAVRAKTCSSCHVGDKDKDRVVSHEMYAAGHPPLPGFEVSTFSEAEPPHWQAMKDVAYLKLSDSALMKKYGVQQFNEQKPRFEALRKNYRVDEFPTQQAKLVSVGGVVTFREAMNLFAATAPTDRSANPEFARFDCASCHHELAVSEDSFRQARGFVADPGRPPAADWPAALVSIAIAAGEPDDAKAKVKMDELGRRLETFRRAVAKVPFGGDDKAAIAEAKALATWADGLVTELDARKFDTADALRILKQITTIQPPDHASARQLAWAFRSVHNELGDKSPNAKEITATVDQLVESLGIRLQKGSKPDTIEREVGARLDADDKFKPDDVKRLFARLAELLRSR